MDLAQRLKAFMETYSLASTTFADKCGIPRPSFSQLLNGRNKKVSDEVIGKIHDAYPQLNVLWLMFGEGSMENEPNMQFSEPENIDLNQGISIQHIANKNNTIHNIADGTCQPEKDEKIDSHEYSPFYNTANPTLTSTEAFAPQSKSDIQTKSQPSATQPSNSIRKVSSIMVFYTDNSFETFVPK